MAVNTKLDPKEVGKSNNSNDYLNDLKDLNELKFKVIGDVQVGFQYFQNATKEDGTPGAFPVRTELPPEEVIDPFVSKYGASKPSQFMAMAIYDYSDNRIKLWTVTKKTIIGTLMAVELDEDLGEIQDYDFKVKKTGAGMETEYEVLRLEKSEVTPAMQEKYDNAHINMQDFMDGVGGIGEKKEAKEAEPSEDQPF